MQKITKTTGQKVKIKEQVVEVAKTKDELSVILTAKDEKRREKKLIEDKTKAFDTALSRQWAQFQYWCLGYIGNFISLASGATDRLVQGSGHTRTWATMVDVSLDPAEVRCKYCKIYIFCWYLFKYGGIFKNVDAVCDSCSGVIKLIL